MGTSDSIEGFNDLVGQSHLFSESSPLFIFYHQKSKPPSLILFGPPGTGKTTYAKLLAKKHDLPFFFLNATDCATQYLKNILKKGSKSSPILVVIDEIHRFDKKQQDILLPFLEEESVVLVGTSTFNPYFKLTKALRSRCFLYEFKKLSEGDLIKIAKRIYSNINEKILKKAVMYANGDARKLINMLKILKENNNKNINIEEMFSIDLGYKNESERYDLMSAFIKSIRGSDVNASLYYLARMLEAGEDAEFIARRLCILASEDIGLADNSALNIASSTLNIVKEIGMPEAKITLAHCCVYLAKAKKSNSCYLAIKRAINDIRNGNIMEVPTYLTVKGRKKYVNPHNLKGSSTSIKQTYLAKPVKYFVPKENDKI